MTGSMPGDLADMHPDICTACSALGKATGDCGSPRLPRAVAAKPWIDDMEG